MIAVNQPISKKPAKLNLNRVVAAMSAKGGMKLSAVMAAKGLVFRKMKEPAQWMMEATSIPSSTAALMPFLARATMANRPTNMVMTVSTMVS